MKTYQIVEVVGDNGESEIISCNDFNLRAMSKRAWRKLLAEKFGSAILEIKFGEAE